ncbi:FAD-binding oxidoreductase [Halogranum amylolyticum]|nr:FAD-dependent oxidoreductase [Halogranum amylolyticum]
MVDKHPAVIARCASAADVIGAVEFANERDVPVSVHGGGHSVVGRIAGDDGLLIDLARMNSIRVDPTTATARVEPGVGLDELARETHAFGFETPVGYNATTGVAGLTLGGGFSWLSRKYGVTIDNLLSADIVTADGDLVHASETDNEGLFGRLQCGENVSLVTSFNFQLPRRESPTDRRDVSRTARRRIQYNDPSNNNS